MFHVGKKLYKNCWNSFPFSWRCHSNKRTKVTSFHVKNRMSYSFDFFASSI